MVPSLEQLRALKRGNDERILAARKRRQDLAEKKLADLTPNLDFEEKTVFSAAFRISKNVGTIYDVDLMDALGTTAVNNLDILSKKLRQRKKGLTPNILWANVPYIDPHRKERQKSGLVGRSVIIDLGDRRKINKPLRRAA